MAVKKVNTSGVTSGKYGDYEYGSLTSYDPKYETQINDNLSKIENYGDYQSQYQPQINDALSRVTDKTPYTSRYQAQIDDYVNKLSSAYDPNADASEVPSGLSISSLEQVKYGFSLIAILTI